MDDRIINQAALFSVSSRADLSVSQWFYAHREIFHRIIIPARIKQEIRDKLDQANINERTLFPGLDGLSLWLTRYYSPTAPQHLVSRDFREGVNSGQVLGTEAARLGRPPSGAAAKRRPGAKMTDQRLAG